MISKLVRRRSTKKTGRSRARRPISKARGGRCRFLSNDDSEEMRIASHGPSLPVTKSGELSQTGSPWPDHMTVPRLRSLGGGGPWKAEPHIALVPTLAEELSRDRYHRRSRVPNSSFFGELRVDYPCCVGLKDDMVVASGREVVGMDVRSIGGALAAGHNETI